MQGNVIDNGNVRADPPPDSPISVGALFPGLEPSGMRENNTKMDSLNLIFCFHFYQLMPVRIFATLSRGAHSVLPCTFQV